MYRVRTEYLKYLLMCVGIPNLGIQILLWNQEQPAPQFGMNLVKPVDDSKIVIVSVDRATIFNF